MDQLRNLAAISRLKSMLSSGGKAKVVSVHFVWHAVLVAVLVFAVTLAVSAWFSYEWAIKETTVPFSRASRDAFSIEELRSVIGVYQTKEVDHDLLRQTRPKAPSLGAEINMSANVGN